jgi:deoxyadenosine/deoxycytidine kinase
LAEEFGAELIHERFIENPFLEKFYQSPAEYAFPLELSFLMERFTQLKPYADPKHFSEKVYIGDYFFDKCLVFARKNLPEDQYILYKQLHNALATQLPEPEIIVFLYNRVEALQQNIALRGRSFEQNIPNEYLTSIEESYAQYFETVTDKPVLILDITESNFVKDEAKYSDIKNLLYQNWPLGTTFIKI